jgi:hypothetical protein
MDPLQFDSLQAAWAAWTAASACYGALMPTALRAHCPESWSSAAIGAALDKAARIARAEHEGPDGVPGQCGPDPAGVLVAFGAYGPESLAFGSGRTEATLWKSGLGYLVTVRVKDGYEEEDGVQDSALFRYNAAKATL